MGQAKMGVKYVNKDSDGSLKPSWGRFISIIQVDFIHLRHLEGPGCSLQVKYAHVRCAVKRETAPLRLWATFSDVICEKRIFALPPFPPNPPFVSVGKGCNQILKREKGSKFHRLLQNAA